MKDRLLLLAYLAAVVLITMFHSLVFLSVCLALTGLLAGRRAPSVFKKTALTVLAFNLVVTVSYIVVSHFRGHEFWEYVARLNLRVFTLTSLTFVAFGRINLMKTLSFSRPLGHLLVLAYSQTLTLKRLFDEFRLALKSRSPRRPSLKDLYRHGASTGAFFTQKSLHDAAEITQAMKSRGFFID